MNQITGTEQELKDFFSFVGKNDVEWVEHNSLDCALDSARRNTYSRSALVYYWDRSGEPKLIGYWIKIEPMTGSIGSEPDKIFPSDAPDNYAVILYKNGRPVGTYRLDKNPSNFRKELDASSKLFLETMLKIK